MEEIAMPTVAEDVKEATIAAWLKQPGDRVEEGEIIAEALTDKANVEIPSPVGGVVEALLAEVGDVVAAGRPIARVRTRSA